MKLKYTGLLIVLGGLLISSCKKNKTVFDDPYSGGKAALGIVSDAQQIPVPASGVAGTVVSITATGLLPWKDKLTFLFNGQLAKIVEVTATGIKVEVPGKASTGVTAFVVDGQLVFGPIFTVVGKVNLDPTFATTIGTDGPVLKAFPVPTSTSLIIMGNFTNYDGKGTIRKINRITRILADGTWDRTFQSGAGANATVYNIAQVGAYYYPVGDFSGYAQQGNMNCITRIAPTGVIDTVQTLTYLKKAPYVPTFNGGFVGGTALNIFPVGSNKMTVVGNFKYYVSRRYDVESYRSLDSTAIDSIICTGIARLNDNGSLDKTWRFDTTAIGYRGFKGKSLIGANGPIANAIGHTNGSIMLYGAFSTFDGASAGNLVRIDANGNIDPTFNVGSGADGYIYSVSYNATLNKYLLCGIFNNFNGKASKYMVQLNYDGSVDPTFVPKVFDGGLPSFVKLLNDGLIVVSGGFKSYDGVIRNQMMVLDATGALADGYNTTGNVGGVLQDVYETRSSDNKRALLLMGSFNSFDSKIRNNIVRVTFE